MSFKCTLWPSGESLELSGTEPLLQELKKSGKKIKSSCGGCASCGDCVVIVKSGESNLTPQTFEELRLLGNVFHITKERLSCQTKVTGDITIDISTHEKNTFTGKNEKPAAGPKSTQVKVRKKEELEQKSKENKEEKPSSDWYRHWEKEEKDDSKAKRLGGGKRPKPFRYDKEDNKNEEDNEE